MPDQGFDITLQTVAAAAPSAVATQLDDEVVLLDVERSAYYGLAHAGVRAWTRLAAGPTPASALVGEVQALYPDTPRALIERDVLALLTHLHEQQLIVVDDEIAAMGEVRVDAAPRPATDPSVERGEGRRPDDRTVRAAVEELRALRAAERKRTSGPWWSRPVGDWWMLARALVLTILVRAALPLWSLRRVTTALKRIARRLPRTGRATMAYRRQAAWAAHAVGARLLPKRPCLTQALVLQYLLLRRGDALAELHIGVAKGEDGELLAHAWIERGGRVLIGGSTSPRTYRRLPGLNERLLV